MRRFASERPRHRFGKVPYQAEDFGLDADRIRGRFAAYARRFDLGWSA